MSLEIDDDALKNILAEVGALVEPMLKSEVKNLNKADGEEEEAPPAEASAPKEEDSPTEESTPAPAGGPPEQSAPPAGPPGGAPPMDAGPGGPPGADPSGGLPDDPAALMDMMAQLPPEKLKAIYMASKQALLAMKGAAGPGAAGPASPPAGPPGMGAGGPPPEQSGPPAGAPPMPPPAMKGEMKASPGNGSVAKKSEKDNEDLKALVKTQGDQIALLTTAITKMVATPIRKAITNVSSLGKSESVPTEINLSKKEVTEALSEKVRSQSLSKKDKEAVRKYYDQGCKDLGLVAHLLT